MIVVLGLGIPTLSENELTSVFRCLRLVSLERWGNSNNKKTVCIENKRKYCTYRKIKQRQKSLRRGVGVKVGKLKYGVKEK